MVNHIESVLCGGNVFFFSNALVSFNYCFELSFFLLYLGPSPFSPSRHFLSSLPLNSSRSFCNFATFFQRPPLLVTAISPLYRSGVLFPDWARRKEGVMRPKIVLFGDSITEESFAVGGWGARLANHFNRTVCSLSLSTSQTHYLPPVRPCCRSSSSLLHSVTDDAFSCYRSSCGESCDRRT